MDKQFTSTQKDGLCKLIKWCDDLYSKGIKSVDYKYNGMVADVRIMRKMLERHQYNETYSLEDAEILNQIRDVYNAYII
jgi:hypothetical protein